MAAVIGSIGALIFMLAVITGSILLAFAAFDAAATAVERRVAAARNPRA